MRQYVLKRLCLVVPTLLLISVIVFSLNHMLPGDVVVLMFEEKAYAKDLDALRAKLGLDRPLYVQYFSWLGDVVQGNLGESLWTKRPVVEELMRRGPGTFGLRAVGLGFSPPLALPGGVRWGIRNDTLQHHFVRRLSVVCLAGTPSSKA